MRVLENRVPSSLSQILVLNHCPCKSTKYYPKKTHKMKMELGVLRRKVFSNDSFKF